MCFIIAVYFLDLRVCIIFVLVIGAVEQVVRNKLNCNVAKIQRRNTEAVVVFLHESPAHKREINVSPLSSTGNRTHKAANLFTAGIWAEKLN